MLAPLAALLLAPAPFTITGTKVMTGLRAVSLAASPTGTRIAVGQDDGTIQIIDAKTRQVLKKLTGHPQTVGALAWSPNGKYLASGDATARIFIWNTAAGWTKTQIRPHTKAIQALSFDKTSTLLASTGNDDMVLVWKVGSWKKEQAKILGKGANLYSATFIPGTTNLAIATLTAGPRVCSAKGTSLFSIAAHDGLGCSGVAVNASGTRFATAGRNSKTAVYDYKAKKRLGYLSGHQDWVIGCTFSPDGKWIASSSSDRTVRVYSVYTYACAATMNDMSAVGSPLCFTGDGKYLCGADISDNVVIASVSY